ncbi:MAG TPA: hypothetical protein VMZ26_17480 [Pyrinomonadaceae bacterium]|nr:hypothetical protein [Pyrinomonadaceae bacterium]
MAEGNHPNSNEIEASPEQLDVVGEAPKKNPYSGSLEELFSNPEFSDPEVEELEREIAATPLSELRRSAWETRLPRKLSHKHKYLIQLFALGFKMKEIVAKTGYSQPWLSELSKHPDFVREIDKVRKETFGESLENYLRAGVSDAAKVVVETIRDEQAKRELRVDAAFRLMDRTHGKPAQKVEHTGSLLKDLFAQLDSYDPEANTPKPIDIDAEWKNADPSTGRITEDTSLVDELTAEEKTEDGEEKRSEEEPNLG